MQSAFSTSWSSLIFAQYAIEVEKLLCLSFICS